MHGGEALSPAGGQGGGAELGVGHKNVVHVRGRSQSQRMEPAVFRGWGPVGSKARGLSQGPH